MKTIGTASALMATAPVLLPPTASAAIKGPARAPGNYAIELDGVHAGFIASAEGGNAAGDVVTEKQGPDLVQRKHIGNVKYEDIAVTFGAGMRKGFYEWIKASLDHNAMLKNGAIVAADFDYKEQSRLNFFNALITEVGFPALDAASKDAAKITVKFAPEYTERAGGNEGTLPAVAKQHKNFLVSNFRLDIGGLDCRRVNKIDAFTIKQKIVENPVGDGHDAEREPAYLEIPNLVITLPETAAGGFYDWHEDFVIKGNNSQKFERNGRLDWMTPDGMFSLGTLEFIHLGIFKLTPDKLESGSDRIRRVKAEMYCEEVVFTFNATSP